jgi:hypothetical protein
MAFVIICEECGYENPNISGLDKCGNPECGHEIPLNQAPERSRQPRRPPPPPPPTPPPSVPLSAILRFPWGEEVTLTDRLKIGRFDPDEPAIIRDWDAVSQAIAKRLDKSNDEAFGVISRAHAEIYMAGDRLLIVDTASLNGTKLTGAGLPPAGQALDPGKPFELIGGMTVNLGKNKMVLTIDVVAVNRPAAPPRNLTTRLG